MSSSATRAFSWDAIAQDCDRCELRRIWSASATLADQSVRIDSDDRSVFDDFFAAFGGGSPIEGVSTEPALISASVRVGDEASEYGCMRLQTNGAPHAADDAFFGLSFPDCPYQSAVSDDGRWTQIRLTSDVEPIFAYRDNCCLFRKSADWRDKLVSLLYRGSLRLRDDLIFFHASALAVRGRGILIVGPRKGGKSTTALALVARGHSMLADSCACYAPSSGKLLPFWRPVGIRRGPRSKNIDQALATRPVRSVERDESVRVELGTLLPVKAPESVPVQAIFFLRGFAQEPRITAMKCQASDVVNLRPIYSSFVNAPHTQRIFELIRLMSNAKLYELRPGDPDQTALAIEEILA